VSFFGSGFFSGSFGFVSCGLPVPLENPISFLGSSFTFSIVFASSFNDVFSNPPRTNGLSSFLTSDLTSIV